MRQAVLYARVSSKDQEREGFSIPAQLKCLREYAQSHEFNVLREFVDVETAKTTGRSQLCGGGVALSSSPLRKLVISRQNRGFGRQFGALTALTVSSAGNLAEAPAVEVVDGLPDLRIAVHDEGAIACDRLIDGFPGQHQ
jgi:hypothetical protein